MKNLASNIFLKLRKLKFSMFSNNGNVQGNFTQHQPVVCRGKGTLKFMEGVEFGVTNSPFFYNGYGYVEARNKDSKISFGSNVHINNNFCAVAENSISIGNDTLIGFNCTIVDSNGHDLSPTNRNATDPNPKPITIGNNLFIGNNVTILKGVTLGDNIVVAAGAVVTESFTANVVIGGVPAKILSEI